jgi:hypothetical protein
MRLANLMVGDWPLVAREMVDWGSTGRKRALSEEQWRSQEREATTGGSG